MAFSLNKIMIIGTLGKDCEVRFTTSNKCVTSFGVATENSYKKDNNWVRETTWHNVTAWELSDFVKATLVKGAKVYVEGRLTKRDYTDKEGVKRYVTEIISNQIIPLDRNERGQQETGHSTEQTEKPQEDNSDNEDENSLPF
jgi:single-strand DNA-binding protein